MKVYFQIAECSLTYAKLANIFIPPALTARNYATYDS